MIKGEKRDGIKRRFETFDSLVATRRISYVKRPPLQLQSADFNGATRRIDNDEKKNGRIVWQRTALPPAESKFPKRRDATRKQI